MPVAPIAQSSAIECQNRAVLPRNAVTKLIAAASLTLLASCGNKPHTNGGRTAIDRKIHKGETYTASNIIAPARSKEQLDAFISAFAATNRFRSGRPTQATIAPDGSAIYYLRGGPRQRTQDLYEYNINSGQTRVLLTAQTLLSGKEEVLTADELARRERMRMSSRGVTSFSLSEDGKVMLVPLGTRLFLFYPATGTSREIISNQDGAPIDARLTSDGTLVMCVRGDEVYAYNISNGEERKVTSGAAGTVTNGIAEFVAQEEMGRTEGYWASPDSTLLCYQQTDTAGMEVFSIGDPADPAKPAATWPYPRAGKQNAKVTLWITPLNQQQGGNAAPIQVAWDNNQFPYIAHVTWSKNAPLTILVQNRVQTVQRLLTVDPATGATSLLFEERDPLWINITSKPRWMKDGQSFLWETEQPSVQQPAGKDFCALEVRGRGGELLRTLVTPDQRLVGVTGVDEAQGICYITIAPDSTRSQLASVRLDGIGGVVPITPDNGVYGANISKDGSVMLRSEGTVTSEANTSVMKRGADGVFVAAGELGSAHEQPPFLPGTVLDEVVVDNVLFEASITRPSNYDVSKRYPVIVQVYGGPHSNTVGASRNGYMMDQWFAEHGFIVVRFDNRGTPKRGRAFERTIKNNVIDIPLADQAAALKALGAKHKQLDLARVGITGWSFGGYFSAMATMRMPEVFKCGVAGAPVTEWEDYDTHYTERYMGLPQENVDGYKAANVLTYTKDLRVPLLIIHGTADDNVYFTHSLKMTRDLFAAGRTFEFIPLAGQTHMVSDAKQTELIQKRIAAFFIEHLGK